MRRRGATPEPEFPARPCDAPGCAEVGQFRAPRSRSALQEYLWFCLPHVREYNGAWDYYRGMGPAEIEDNLRADTAWQRPTWPLGRLGATGRYDAELLRDPLGVLRGEAPAARRTTPEPPRVPPELRAALDVLGLEWPVDNSLLRARYKELAKLYHPDATGGDRAAEDRFKDVNRAYSLLRARLSAAGRVAAEAPAV